MKLSNFTGIHRFSLDMSTGECTFRPMGRPDSIESFAAMARSVDPPVHRDTVRYWYRRDIRGFRALVQRVGPGRKAKVTRAEFRRWLHSMGMEMAKGGGR